METTAVPAGRARPSERATSPREPPRVEPTEAPALEALFHRAIDLAFFVLGDSALAAEAAVEAVAKLRVAVQAQERRLSYVPKGRRREAETARPARTRVNVAEAHLLQRLVYVECEAAERSQEHEGAVDDRRMLVRFVKHLVRITLKRTSFYVTLGVSRLLHGYSTAQTMDLYALVIQDPGRVRDAHYYRSRKKRLLEEMLERFGDRLSVEDGAGGERRVRTRPPDAESAALIRESLRRFTPWDTPCVVPEGLDRWSSEIPALLFEGDDADAEHPVETRRIHASVDPECYARLTRALDLPPPEERLAPPEFTRSASRPRAGGPTPGPRPPADAWARACARLDGESHDRRHRRARVAVVLVDGVEYARLDEATDTVTVHVPADVERIEIRAVDGPWLAVWLAGAAPPAGRIVLESGREIAIERRPSADVDHLSFDVRCREVGLGSRLEAIRRRLRRIFEVPMLPAWATVAVLTLAVLLARPTAPPPRESAPVPASGTSSSTLPTAPPARAHVPIRPPAAAPSTPPRELTRGRSPRSARRLADVRQIFVDPPGSDASAQAWRDALARALTSSERFALASQRRDADAVLKVSIGDDGGSRLELVNVAGTVLWSHDAPANAHPSEIVRALEGAAARAATASRPAR